MSLFRNLPIKSKLNGITMLTSCVALLLACLAFVLFERATWYRTIARDFAVIADMYDDDVAPGISFNDLKSIEQTLKTLSAHPRILAAAVYDKAGDLMAQYERSDLRGKFKMPAARRTSSSFQKDRLDTFQDVTLAGEFIGTVYIAGDLQEITSRLRSFAVIVGLVLLVSSLTAFALSSRLQRVISEPIFHLANTARVVAEEKNYSIRAVKHSQDELGGLIDGFNEMLGQIEKQADALKEGRESLEKRVEERTKELKQEIEDRKDAEARLEATHKQLVDASRQAGMAEVATGVLHNVGNVLNSVNVTANFLTEQIKKSRVSDVCKLAALLKEHANDVGTFLTADPKGRKVIDFLGQLSEKLTAEQSSHLKELEALRGNIEHIKDIVAMQQNYAKVSGVMETVKLTDLIEDTLRMNAGALVRHDVKVIREFQEVRAISTEKHKVLQILVNLVRNAKYACDESGRPDKFITFRLVNGGDRVKISVIDNGVGIPPENMTRIFNHGFTTRKEGHGFGLHSGALAAKELGGELTAQSDGRGMGAAFTLELPIPSDTQPASK